MRAGAQQPRLLYLGNFTVPWTTENHVAASFQSLGWDVAFAQESRIAAEGVGSRMWAQFIRAAANSDLVLYTRTPPGMPQDATIALWERLAVAGVPTATLHLDLFIGLHREGRQSIIERDPLFRTAHVFTADGDHDDDWKRFGVNHHWLPPGVYHAECQMAAADPAMRAQFDVAFVGSEKYHTEWPWRQELLSLVRNRYGDRFLKVGDGRPTIRGRELNRLYASVPVIIGDSIRMAGRTQRYVSDRVFETTGRGGFLLFPQIDWVRDAFGGVVPMYEPGDPAVLDQIDGWLAAPDSYRDEQRDKAQAITVGGHTYRHRVAQLLDTINLPHDEV